MKLISRSRAAELGRQTAAIVSAGRYRAPSGELVRLGHLIQAAVDATLDLPATLELALLPEATHDTRIEVHNTDTFSAARQLVDQGHRVAALSFASAKHPGGGWLSGARAQEESLARSSALVATLEGLSFYEIHQRQADPIYTDHVIYSPGVPVFRSHDGTLLDAPWTVDVLTAAAVNARRLGERSPGRSSELDGAMRGRIERVLHVAALQGADAVVLGAWGCGAFRNDPEQMAQRFRDVLSGPMRGRFAQITFAILDWSDRRRFLGPFARAFGRPMI